MQSVREQPSLVACLFVYGALREVAAREVTKPPSPKGQHPRSRHTILLPTPWEHVQKESRTFSPTSFAFLGSRGGGCVSPRTCVSGTRAIEGNRPPSLQKLLEPEPSRDNQSPRLQKVLAFFSHQPGELDPQPGGQRHFTTVLFGSSPPTRCTTSEVQLEHGAPNLVAPLLPVSKNKGCDPHCGTATTQEKTEERARRNL